MVSPSLRLKVSCASCGPIVIIRSRREKEESEGESEEGGEKGEEGEEEEEDAGESASGTSKGIEEIVPLTEEDITAARSSRKEEKKQAKAAAGVVNDEDADLPVNANRLPVKNMAISDINVPREPSRKERFVAVHGPLLQRPNCEPGRPKRSKRQRSGTGR